ncbi:type I-E CRISPR-associated protein Cas5/CasD [Saccharomonospora azurea]|uniref:type I-E CRISPR-associated protein Cas5/CasD n=1 Tax=Saccharomonospora azurea TaxID=40988 RepID=UPI00332A15F6
MTGILLQLGGPMQSWGDSSQWNHRQTLGYPTRSGLIGLIAAALGIRRGEDLADLDPLRFTVRVDRPGRRIIDFHTVGGGGLKLPRAKGGHRDEPIVSHRHYLSDAVFTIAVAGPDSLMSRVGRALRAPVYAPFLGRRSCPPGGPLVIGATDDPMRDLREVVPLARPRPLDVETVPVEFVVDGTAEVPDGAIVRQETTRTRPIKFGQTREHRNHTITRWEEPLPSELCGGRGIRYLEALEQAWNPQPA